jgi:hypothetical protein
VSFLFNNSCLISVPLASLFDPKALDCSQFPGWIDARVSVRVHACRCVHVQRTWLSNEKITAGFTSCQDTKLSRFFFCLMHSTILLCIFPNLDYEIKVSKTPTTFDTSYLIFVRCCMYRRFCGDLCMRVGSKHKGLLCTCHSARRWILNSKNVTSGIIL